MKSKILVLGCGLVGQTMAKDLAADDEFTVTAADLNPKSLDALAPIKGIETMHADLSQPAKLKMMVEPFALVLGALPSRFGFQTLRTMIEAGKPFCDISFMPEDALELDSLAKAKGVTAVVDCGVAPGLANMAIGYAQSQLDSLDQVAYYVGGLPKERCWPFEYKAPFSPADVIEEYTRPARLIENGQVVTKPALSDPELIDFPGLGTLEAFNTDGLRSLLTLCKATNMREKTLRYPGHAELMRVMRESGFFSKEPIRVGTSEVRPLDVTSALLFPLWQKRPNEQEFTVLKVQVEGSKDGRRLLHLFDLYDEFDPKTGDSSMARTTGFPCTIVARCLASGRFSKPGVFPPELLGKEPDMFSHVVSELKKRGVELRHQIEALKGTKVPS